MPHKPKPFYKANRRTWYVQLGPVQHALGKQPDTAPPPQKRNGVWDAPPEIDAAFHKLMARAAEAPDAQPVREVLGQPLVLAVFDDFLDWTQKHRAKLTYIWYRDRIQAFAQTLDRRLPAADLRRIHVERWVDAHPDWSPSHQRGCKVAVQRAFAWAEKMGVIDRSPIRHLEKPAQGRREQLISEAEHRTILSHFPNGDPFRDLLEMAWHTGARPQEIVRLEARHLDAVQRRIVLPPSEAKGKKRYRVIYLNDEALALATARAAEQPRGPFFRNRDGAPWTAFAVNNRFCRLQRALGRVNTVEPPTPEAVAALAAVLPPSKKAKGVTMKKTAKELLCEARKKLLAKAAAAQGRKYALYAYRHSFAQRLLVAGVDALTVSTLLGHVDGTMLSRVYSHLQQNSDHLLKALNGGIKTADA